MRKELARAIQRPVLFLDDWPQPPKCANDEEDELQNYPGLSEVKKWRLQMLLAVNPWGIPSLAFGEAYRRMFGRELDVRAFGFEHLFDMVSNLPDVFTIQEPDEITAFMFPDYSHDKILHDARLGHNFDFTTQEREQAAIGHPKMEYGFDERQHDLVTNTFGNNNTTPTTIAENLCIQQQQQQQQQRDYNNVSKSKGPGGRIDTDTLIAYAWVNRDVDFPPDVILAGEQYSELILPMTSANIPGTRGVHWAMIIGAASPNHFYVNIKNDFLDQVVRLSDDVESYFQEKKEKYPIEMYSVPDEFIYPGFPCLAYDEIAQIWERVEVLDRHSKGNKVRVEAVDYGGEKFVNQIYLYLLPRKFFDIPKQKVRVSLIGLKPPDGSDKWSTTVGTRMRCWSNFHYWLDVLLVEPKKMVNQESLSICGGGNENGSSGEAASTSSDGAKTSNQQTNTISVKKKKKLLRQPDFEVLVCDRNDEDLDLYLDKILTLETYAIFDDSRKEQVDRLRKQLDTALANVPRPVNPLQSKKPNLMGLDEKEE